MPELGDQITIHRGQPFKRTDLSWIIPGMVCILVPLVTGIWVYQYFDVQNGSAAAINRSLPWFSIAYLALLMIGSYGLYRAAVARRFVVVYQNGIRCRASGLRVRSYFWQDLQGIAVSTVEERLLSKILGKQVKALLYPVHGSPVELNNTLQDLPGLVETIKEEYYPIRQEQMLNMFESGEPLEFGPLAIQSESIQIPNHIQPGEFIYKAPRRKNASRVPWERVRQLSVQGGFLVVQSENSKPKRIPVSQIPNFEIMLKIIEQGVHP